MATYTHDPDADLDYGHDWSAWLGADTITTSTWTVTSPSGDTSMTLHGSTHDANTTTVWAAGGTAGKNYSIINHVITAAGREDDRSHLLRCRNR